MALGAVRYSPAEPDSDDGMMVPIAEFVLRARQLGIVDRRLMAALEAVPRTLFLDGDARFGPLYAQRPQPIACGQTTTPPIIIARMLAAIAPLDRDRVLEIGTGTGYLSAVLSMLVRHVYTIERFRTLVMTAQARFEAIQSDNITSMFGDGSYGLSEKAPFDRIIVTASARTVPAVIAEQLSTHGILVMPIGPPDGVQTLTAFRRIERTLVSTAICPVRIAPLIPGKAARL